MKAACFLFLVLATLVNLTVAQVGQGCGILPAETIGPDYTPPPVRVGGEPGCVIGDQTGCYCSHALDGEIDNNEWKWHCGSDVIFGPMGNRTCPAELPEGECDPATNPSGGPGDPGCGYSDCGGAATFSALCGCVDLSMFGQDGGHVWACIESTCDCPEPESAPTSGAILRLSSQLELLSAVVVCGMLAMLL